jgi:hypothetical protein
MEIEIVQIFSQEIKYLEGWAEFGIKAGITPLGTTPLQAMAIIEIGKEMNLRPFQALRMISFIKGRVTMAVQLQLAIARKGGIELADLKETPTSCTATLKRGNETKTCTYTFEMAKRANLIKPDSNWEKYPTQMLRWRAIGDAIRLIASDIILGLLSPDEAENLIEPSTESIRNTGQHIEMEEGTMLVASDEPKVIEEEKEDIEDTMSALSKARIRRIFFLYRQLGITDKNKIKKDIFELTNFGPEFSLKTFVSNPGAWAKWEGAFQERVLRDIEYTTLRKESA